eukprot:11288867-Heterocapsa_arctica.AAC.1
MEKEAEHHIRRPWVENTYESPRHAILHQPRDDLDNSREGVTEGPATGDDNNTRSFNDRPAQEAYPFAYYIGKH